MVWQAICECGMKSTAFITTSTMTTEHQVVFAKKNSATDTTPQELYFILARFG